MGIMGITYDIYTVSEDMIGSNDGLGQDWIWLDPTGSNQGKSQPETIPEILGPAKMPLHSLPGIWVWLGLSESMGYTPW